MNDGMSAIGIKRTCRVALHMSAITTIGGELQLRLCCNDLLKISRLEQSQKTRWGKHRGKQSGPKGSSPVNQRRGALCRQCRPIR